MRPFCKVTNFVPTLIAVALSSGMAHGQILLPDTVAPHTPIVAGCDCVIPKNATLQLAWRTDPATQFIQSHDGKKLYIWTAPGKHWVELTVITQTFREITVLIPDPTAPNDFSKAKLEKIKIYEAFTIERYDKEFTVTGTPPTPNPPNPPGPNPPGPNPPNPPPPDVDPGGQVGEVRKWLKAIPATHYSKAKALGIADNFTTIGSQGSDPARNQGWNLDAFRTKTRDMNLQTLSTAEAAAWADPFFKPLATWQSKVFAERNLTVSDVKGIAKLWMDTADLIREAANFGAGDKPDRTEILPDYKYGFPTIEFGGKTVAVYPSDQPKLDRIVAVELLKE